MYSSSATAVHFILMNFINRTFIALVFYSTSGTSNRSDYGDQIKPEFYVTFFWKCSVTQPKQSRLKNLVCELLPSKRELRSANLSLQMRTVRLANDHGNFGDVNTLNIVIMAH